MSPLVAELPLAAGQCRFAGLISSVPTVRATASTCAEQQVSPPRGRRPFSSPSPGRRPGEGCEQEPRYRPNGPILLPLNKARGPAVFGQRLFAFAGWGPSPVIRRGQPARNDRQHSVLRRSFYLYICSFPYRVYRAGLFNFKPKMRIRAAAATHETLLEPYPSGSMLVHSALCAQCPAATLRVVHDPSPAAGPAFMPGR